MRSSTEVLAGQQLAGGTANRGRVIRVGHTVHRPSGPHTPAVHALLGHLTAAGFAGAPQAIAVNGTTEVLTYLDGTAAVEPLAAWALSADAVADVGALLRRYHIGAASFDPRGHLWQRAVPAPWRGTLVTHNDVNPANVIFRGGRPMALIDFDLAAPACPAWELAIAACFWAPLRNGDDIVDSRSGRVHSRFRDLLEGYGAPTKLRRQVAEASIAANAWIAGIIEEASMRGHPAFGRVWASQAQMYARADDWLRRNHRRLLDVACS